MGEYGENKEIVICFQLKKLTFLHYQLRIIIIMTTKLNEKQLKTLVRDSVKEALTSELLKLRALTLPYISSREQKDIERLYTRPSRRIARTYQINV